ncbi:PRC-barrel domain-containing protein [Sphingomonas oleivorans]|nr:PRC-barrel domain-containing protein [Sphingomonas oleivorans]
MKPLELFDHRARPAREGRGRLRRWSGIAFISALAPMLAGIGSVATAQEPVAITVVDVQTVALGYRTSELIGRPVSNGRETIGRIDDLVIGRDKVLFAIISVGGFLGLGDRKVAIPYSSLQVTPDSIVFPGATDAALRKLPEFRYR